MSVTFGAAGVAPPAARYIGAGEALRVDTWSSIAPAALAIVARVLTPGGEVHTSRWMHTPNTDRSLATTYHDLDEGWLLAVSVDATGLAYMAGQCWCQVGIQVGGGAAGVPHAQLIADYVSGARRLAWPGGRIARAGEGPGRIGVITGADPAAGAEVSYTCLTNARFRLMGLRFTLVTDATAVNRQVDLVIDDGATVLLRIEPPAMQGASGTRVYTYGPGLPARSLLTQEFLVPLPVGLVVDGGYRLRTVTGNLQAGDDYSEPVILVEWWVMP